MKKIISVLILVMVLSIGLIAFDQTALAIVPEPFYELEIGPFATKKYAQTVEQTYYAYKDWQETISLVEGYNDQETMTRAIFGGTKLLGLQNKDWSDMDLRDWEEVINTSKDIYFENTDEIVKDNIVDFTENFNMEDEREHLNNAVAVWQNKRSRDKSKDEQPKNEEEKIKEAKAKVKSREEQLNNMYSEQLLKYEDQIALPNDETVDPSELLKEHNKETMQDWIDKTQTELITVQEKFNNGELDKANIAANLQVQSQLLLLIAQTQLRQVQSLKDLNRMMTYTTMYQNYDRIDQRKIDIRINELD